MREVTRPRGLKLDWRSHRMSIIISKVRRGSMLLHTTVKHSTLEDVLTEMNEVMSKGSGKGRYTRPLATYLKGWMLTYEERREEKSCVKGSLAFTSMRWGSSHPTSNNPVLTQAYIWRFCGVHFLSPSIFVFEQSKTVWMILTLRQQL